MRDEDISSKMLSIGRAKFRIEIYKISEKKLKRL